MAPPSGDPKRLWKLGFVEIFGFPLPRQLEYMIISSVQSLIAQSEVIRDAFLNTQSSGGHAQVDRNFSNKELVQQLQDYYWSLSVGFEELLGVPFANLEQNMRDVPDILDRLRIAREAAISDMQTLAGIADGSIKIPVPPRKGKHRADRHERSAPGYPIADSLRGENRGHRYRPDRHGHRGIINTGGESSSMVLENARTRRPNQRDQRRHRDTRGAPPALIDDPEEQPMTMNTARAIPRDHQHPNTNAIDRPESSAQHDVENSRRRRGKQRADPFPQRDIPTGQGERAVLDAATQASQTLAERLQSADQKKRQKRMEHHSQKLAEELQADDHRKVQGEVEKKSRKLARELQAEEERNLETETAELMAASLQQREEGTTIGERARRRYRWQPGDDDENHRSADYSGHRRRDRDRRETGQRVQSPLIGNPQPNPTRRQRDRREANHPEQSIPPSSPQPATPPPRRRRSITDL